MSRIPYDCTGVIPASLLPFDTELRIDEANYRKHLRDIAAVRGVAAVSYTHLDVYKRQVQARIGPAGQFLAQHPHEFVAVRHAVGRERLQLSLIHI